MLTEDIISHSEPQNQDKNRFWRKSYITCQILNEHFLTRHILKQNLHNASDFDSKVLHYNASHFGLKKIQRVRFWIKNFTTRPILKKKNIIKKHDFGKKVFKEHDFEEKIVFKKQILKKTFAHKKSRSVSSYNVLCTNFAFLRGFLKSTVLRKKTFLKSVILIVIFFLKSMILNEENFAKSLILKKKVFVWSDFESKFFRFVRFRINFFAVLQMSNWIFYDVSDFECTSFAKFCQIFLRSTKQGRFGNVLWYCMGSVNQVILLG